MERQTGRYRVTESGGEEVSAFIPLPLPPDQPPLAVDEPAIQRQLTLAQIAVSQLRIAGNMVPSEDWFLYGFVRKEAVISSQIEGTQATLEDVLNFEVTQQSTCPTDVEEVCNYVEALTYSRREISRPRGLPLSSRLLCGAHKRLMHGVRGAEKKPGQIRTSQNWIGGSRPGNAVFVPPPPDTIAELLADLDRWIHGEDSLPSLIRIGLAHVQFESIHPFLDGNGRIGRLLVALLMEHWDLLDGPLLYISLPLKRRREEYYRRLSAVRTNGDWEGWIVFFLECIIEAADDGVQAANQIFATLNSDRNRLLDHPDVTLPAVRLLNQLPAHPIITLATATALLGTSKPTAIKAIDSLLKAGILVETTGKKRDRVYAYQSYLAILTSDTEF